MLTYKTALFSALAGIISVTSALSQTSFSEYEQPPEGEATVTFQSPPRADAQSVPQDINGDWQQIVEMIANLPENTGASDPAPPCMSSGNQGTLKNIGDAVGAQFGGCPPANCSPKGCPAIWGDAKKAGWCPSGPKNKTPKGEPKNKQNVTRATLDPVTSKIIRSVLDRPEVSKALESLSRSRGGACSVVPTVFPKATNVDALLPEGVDTALNGFGGGQYDIVFQVKVPNVKATDREKAEYKPTVVRGAGVYPDDLTPVREAIKNAVSEVNASLYGAVVLASAARVSELEVEALENALRFEEIRCDAGVGEPQKRDATRARLQQAVVDQDVVSRKYREESNRFLALTGTRFSNVKLADGDSIFRIQLTDPDFARITSEAAERSVNTAGASAMVQRLAGNLVVSSQQLADQREVADLAAIALGRVRERMDAGASNEAEEAVTRALFLNSQKKELVALSNYLQSRAHAYPNCTLSEDQKADPVNVDTKSIESKRGKSILWGGLGVVLLLALFVAVALGRRKPTDNNESWG